LLLVAVALGSLPGRPEAATAPSFALLELFTSEGCSSCPPADRLLATEAAEAKRDGRKLLALEFHVDYWDRLGWKDPFSDAAFTARQVRYQRWFGLRSAYTPQLVVNGRSQCVGSDARAVARAIAEALATPAELRLDARATVGTHEVVVEYTVAGSQPGDELCVAVVEPAATTRVTAGENTGRTLAHTGIVRTLVSRPVGTSRSGRVAIPWTGSSYGGPVRVVAFVQDPATGRIRGATEAAEGG
jgi:hypothetical protein